MTGGVVGLRKSVRAIVSSRDAKGVVEETRSRSSGWDSGAVQRLAGDLNVQQQDAMPSTRAEPRARLVRDDADIASDGLAKEPPSRSALRRRHERSRHNRPGVAKNQSQSSVRHAPVVRTLDEGALVEGEEDSVDEGRKRAEVAGREFELAPQSSHQTIGLLSGESPSTDEAREVALDFKDFVGRVHARSTRSTPLLRDNVARPRATREWAAGPNFRGEAEGCQRSGHWTAEERPRCSCHRRRRET